MELFLDIATALFLLVGSVFAVIGGIGIVRLPDFYSRLHGGGVTDTMGAGLIMLGLMFQSGLSLATAKLLMILLFLVMTSPTGCHALAQAAINEGLKPTDSSESEE